MAQVSVRELKSRLTHYLRRSERGEQFTVTRRGKPVAVLSGAGKDDSLKGLLRKLAAEGVISWSDKKFVPPAKRVRLQGDGPSISEMVLEDRR